MNLGNNLISFKFHRWIGKISAKEDTHSVNVQYYHLEVEVYPILYFQRRVIVYGSVTRYGPQCAASARG